MKWNICTDPDYIWIEGKSCNITIEPRPRYCDRGNWIAKIFGPAMEKKCAVVQDLHIDEQDGWPRYYFDLDRAKLECEAWLNKRGQACQS